MFATVRNAFLDGAHNRVAPQSSHRTVMAMFTRRSAHPSLTNMFSNSVPISELDTLDRLATVITVQPGHRLIAADGYGRECFVVIAGELGVKLEDVTVKLGPGSVVGELSLLTLKPRTADVVAITEATVYVLTRAEFATLLDDCPNLANQVLTEAVRRAS